TGKKSEKVISKPKSYTIRFYDDGGFKVKSDCNKCSGNYTVAGKFIKLNNLDCSSKFCGKNSYDYLYKKFLNDSSSFSLSSNGLVLESYKGKLLLSKK
ncbi:MAG: META domain-containing protein, partial [Thermodesulfobacteriota bacterium]